MKIVFPEFNHPSIQEALSLYQTLYPQSEIIEPVPAPNLATACELINSHQADAMIAGIDYTSRDIILACRDHFAMAKRPELVTPLQVGATFTPDDPSGNELYSTFSGLAVMQRPIATQRPATGTSSAQTYLIADMAACKHPNKSQLIDIIWQTYFSAKSLLATEPRIALLSFSTLGSGGHDDFITLAREIIPFFRERGLLIDGEMQLDAAVNPAIGAKKAPHSPVAGQANVLIAPDLNSGNLLYKSFEQFGGFTVAGPILQGFDAIVSDLSRGSTPTDIALTIATISRLAASTPR